MRCISFEKGKGGNPHSLMHRLGTERREIFSNGREINEEKIPLQWKKRKVLFVKNAAG
jgi:hypothetical protein